MKKLTAEWVEIAEGEFASADTLIYSGRTNIYRSICNDAPQCAEKYLKAFLQEHNLPSPKSHVLDELLDICVKLDSSLEMLRSDLVGLNPYAVRIRYPGTSADKQDAQAAYEALLRIRSLLRSKLGLPPS